MTEDKKAKMIVGVIGTGGRAMRAFGGSDSKAKAEADPVAVPPTLAGSHGSAWMVDLDTWRRQFLPQRADATIAAIVVEAPWAHPVWHSYILMLIHLRGIDGAPTPVIRRPGATHEFWLYALNPDKPREELIRGLRADGGFLSPMNFGAQLLAANDAAALEQVETAVRDIVDGRLSPDTDFLSSWVARFGDSLLRPEYQR